MKSVPIQEATIREQSRRPVTEAFDRAIEDTITALNTECLRARDGTPLQTVKGKACISNHEWRANRRHSSAATLPLSSGVDRFARCDE